MATLILEANSVDQLSSNYACKVYNKFGNFEPTLQNCYIAFRNTRVYYNDRVTGTNVGAFILDGNVVDEISSGVPSGHTSWAVSKDGTWQWGFRYNDLRYYSEYDVTCYQPNFGGINADNIHGTIEDFSATQCSGYFYEEPDAVLGRWLEHARAYFDSQASKPIYIGVNGRAREVTDMYVGVNGRARKVTAIYVGVNGRAREVFKAT